MAEPKIEQPIILGKITGAFGIKGWVKIHSFATPPEALFGYAPLYIKSPNKALLCVSFDEYRLHGKGYVAKLNEVDDRNQAELLKQAEFIIESDQLPSTEEDEYYWRDLEGLTVINTHQEVLGTVSHLFETGANDVLVVTVPNQSQPCLIPFVIDKIVLSVDFDKALICVDWELDY